MRPILSTPLALLVVGIAGCSGCSSDEAAQSGASLSAISPGTAYIGRTTELSISGVGTHFAGQPLIAFNDAAIKTTRVEVLSPTSLRVALEIGADAAAGPHDVVVTTPGIGETKAEVVSLRGGLIAGASLVFGSAVVDVPRGGLVDFALANVDRDNGFVGAPIFVSGAVAARVTEISPMRLAGTLLVDPLAPIGPLRVRFDARTLRGETLTYVSAPEDPAAPKVVEPKAVLALTPGKVEGSEAIAAPRQSNLYKATVPTSDSVFFLGMATVGASLKSTSGARLVGAMAPSSGRFGDGHTFETTFDGAAGARGAVGLAREAGDAYFAVHTSDLSGGANEYNYSLKLGFAKATQFVMQEPSPPDAPQTPLASIEVDAPAFAVDGAIDTTGDADYVVFTSNKGGRIFVAARPVGSSVPLNVAIFGNDPGDSVCSAYIAGGIGTRQAEVRATAGTPYCARINSTTPSTTKYELVISPEL